MKYAKGFLIMVFGLCMALAGVSSFADEIREWGDVVESTSPVNIYIEDIPNKTGDDVIDAGKVTGVVKEMFAERKNPEFNVVDSKDEADVVFKGKISDYVWSEKAPLTNIYSPGAIVLDEVTRGGKNWARMELDYKIYAAKNGKLLLDYETQVTLKQPGMPKDESYGMIYDRLPKVLAMDVFKRYKRQ